MRLVAARRNLDQTRPFGQFAGHAQFGLVVQQMQIGSGQSGIRHGNPRLARLAQDRVHPRIGILHVEDRVVLRLLHHLVEIEIQRHVVLARQHHETGDIGADLIDHVAQGDERARAFRHLERRAVFPQLDQLHQLDVQRHPALGQCQNRRLHPLDIAAMVRPKNVDQRVKAALHLVVVIGDVGGEIGPGSVGFHHRPVHVIAMRGAAEQGLDARLPILRLLALGRFQHAFVDQPHAAQGVDRRFDLAGAIQRLFR